MRNLTALILLLVASSGQLQAQNSYILNYEWEKSPSINILTEEELKESAVCIKHVVASEIFYQNDNSAIEYYMEHLIKHLNDAEAVDQNNKVYLPSSEASRVDYTIIEKARVIKKTGKVINLDEEDILSEVNEEEGNTRRYFALEGVEIGDEIEYYFIYPRSPRTMGILHRMQNTTLKREAMVTIITPNNLENKFKSFNGFPEMQRDSNYDDKRFYTATAYNLKGLKEEKFAAYNANRAMVAYYLYKIHHTGNTTDFYTTVSKFLATKLGEINPKKSGIDKLIKKMEIGANWSDEEKIKFVENYIKREFRYIKEGMAELDNVQQVVKRKIGDDIGLTKLFGGIFNQLNIDFEVVYTSDRNDLRFDKDFECAIFVDEILFYFPKTKKYLAPVGLNTRYGFPPAQYTNNYGYFTKFMNVGGFKSGIGKIKYIEAISADATVDDFTVTLDLTDLNNTKATLSKKLTGYSALTYQSFFEYIDEKTAKEVKDELVKFIDEGIEVQSVEVMNTKVSDFGVRPFQVDAKFTTDIFLQKAGNNYLVNVGKMIGPQSELYQEEERQLPVSNYYNRAYKRTLIIEIPEGYELANLDDIKMNITYDKDNKKDMGFVSDYKVEGNKLIITANEYYGTIDYPVDEYPNFEKVINAAADFNKVTVLLKKKA